jgi:hypothetical protein
MKRLVIASVLALAACTSAPATYRDLEGMTRDYERGGRSPLAAREDTCGIAAHRDKIGTPIADWEPPAGARVIRPATAVTDDLRRERLNVIVNAEGRITALECY